MNCYFTATTILLSFAFMELVVWLMHKFVMHGFLRVLQRDHHKGGASFGFLFMIPFRHFSEEFNKA